MKPPTHPLRPVIPSNASPLRITAAAGTKLAGASSAGTVIIVPAERTLQSENLLHPRGIAGSGFRALSNIPHCCRPWEFGPCLSPNVADHPLRPATDRRLGRPLPHQLANRTKAPPQATCAFDPQVSCGISASFQALSPPHGQIPTRYSPVRH